MNSSYNNTNQLYEIINIANYVSYPNTDSQIKKKCY